MAKKYLDKDGLTYFWSKTKQLISDSQKNLVDLYSDQTITGSKTFNSDTFYNGSVNATDITANEFIGDLTGNASTANKWSTARTLTLAGDYSGSVSIDGSSNVTLTGYNYGCYVQKEGSVKLPWNHIAHTEGADSYADRSIILLITQPYLNGVSGIIKIDLFSNTQTSTDVGYKYAEARAKWLVRDAALDVDMVKVGVMNVAGAWSADVFIRPRRIPNAWDSINIKQLASGARRGYLNRTWTLLTATESPTTSTNCYETIESYKTYSTIYTSSDVGVVDKANSLTITSIGSVTKPVYINTNGVPTDCTYTLEKSVPSNAVFTDTVYTHPTTSGYKHIPSGGSSGQILRWSADGTAVWGSDNDTTYSTFTASTMINPGTTGLVPAPAAGKQTSFLRGDGTWVVPTDTNTWRGIQNNLTSTSTTDSLAAAQGKILNEKFSSYLPLTGGDLTGPLYLKYLPNSTDTTTYTEMDVAKTNACTIKLTTKEGNAGSILTMDPSGISLNGTPSGTTSGIILKTTGSVVSMIYDSHNVLNITGGASSSSTTGALVVNGGVGISGALNVGNISTSQMSFGTSSDMATISFSTSGLKIFRKGSSITLTGSAVKIKAAAAAAWTTGSGTVAHINSSGELVKYSSSKRYKTNFHYDINRQEYHNELMQFKPLEYSYKSSPQLTERGMIAEDVEKINPNLVVYDDNTKLVESYKDRDVITMLIVEAQEKDKIINQQQKQINELTELVNYIID